MTRLIFVRHGDAIIVEPGRPRSLTQAGIRQAQHAAEVLSDRTIDQIWSSSMLRAAQTAEVIAEELGLPLLLDDRLRERKDEDPAPGVTAQDDHPDHVLERFSSIASEIVDACAGRAALIVSHGAITTRGLLSMCSNLAGEYASQHPLGNGAIVEVVVDEAGGWTCLSWDGHPLTSTSA